MEEMNLPDTRDIRYNLYFVSTYPPRNCGIGTFTRSLVDALWQNCRFRFLELGVVAIDKDGLDYHAPVDDLRIHQEKPVTYRRAASSLLTRAREATTPTVIIFQHEFGLDGPPRVEGHNYVDMLEELSTRPEAKRGTLLNLTYLHTILPKPREYELETIKKIAEYSNAVIVLLEDSIETLKGKPYELDAAKLKHIDHGIRIKRFSEKDREATKKDIGAEGKTLITTLGLRRPDKGERYSIQAFAHFLNSLPESQRENFDYLIAGRCHPEFMRDEGGRYYRKYNGLIKKVLEDSGLSWQEVDWFEDADFKNNRIIIVNNFLKEQDLKRVYTATDCMALAYTGLAQSSSGVLADTIGSGRIAVTTPFAYAKELLFGPGLGKTKGILGIGDKEARGILVDPYEPCIGQMAQAFHYLFVDEQGKKDRLIMEENARARGRDMEWPEVARKLIDHLDFILEGKRLRI